jgi:GAF domain-containing protein
LLTRTFVELADTLVDEFDVVEMLTTLADRCVAVLDVSAAGLMLISPDGDLRAVASSSEAMRMVELFELQTQEGPCLDCYRSRQPVLNQHLGALERRWPHFEPVALEAGFHSVHALPMRLRGNVIGSLNLFRTDRADLEEADIVAGQALADAATITVLQHQAALETQLVNARLSATPSTAGSSSSRPKASSRNGPASRWKRLSRRCATAPETTTRSSSMWRRASSTGRSV